MKGRIRGIKVLENSQGSKGSKRFGYMQCAGFHVRHCLGECRVSEVELHSKVSDCSRRNKELDN